MTQSTLVTEPANGTLESFALPTDTEGPGPDPLDREASRRVCG